MRLNGPAVADVAAKVAFVVDDETHTLELSNGSLHHHPGDDGDAVATIRMSRAAVDAMVTGEDLQTLIADGSVTLDGDLAPVQALVTNLDNFEFWFSIVTP